MTVQEAWHIATGGGQIESSTLNREAIAEAGLGWRRIEHTELKLAHNAGIYNVARKKILDSDIGNNELRYFADNSTEPVMILREKQDNEVHERVIKGQKPSLNELALMSSMIVVPKSMAEGGVIEPAVYVVVPEGGTGVTGLLEKLRDKSMSFDLSVKTIRGRNLEKMMDKYRDSVLGGGRVSRALKALGNR